MTNETPTIEQNATAEATPTELPQAGVMMPSENTQEASPWYFADGIAGAGEKPEYLQSKYRSVAEQAQAYVALETRFGAHKGAPTEYKVEFPKESGFVLDPNNSILKGYLETAKENNVAQSFIDTSLQAMAAYQQSQMPDAAAQKVLLGEDGAVAMETNREWALNTLPADEAEIVCTTIPSVAWVSLMTRTRNATQPLAVPTNKALLPKSLPVNTVDQLTQERIDNYEKYQNDPIYREESLKRLEMAIKAQNNQP